MCWISPLTTKWGGAVAPGRRGARMCASRTWELAKAKHEFRDLEWRFQIAWCSALKFSAHGSSMFRRASGTGGQSGPHRACAAGKAMLWCVPQHISFSRDRMAPAASLHTYLRAWHALHDTSNRPMYIGVWVPATNSWPSAPDASCMRSSKRSGSLIGFPHASWVCCQSLRKRHGELRCVSAG